MSVDKVAYILGHSPAPAMEYMKPVEAPDSGSEHHSRKQQETNYGDRSFAAPSCHHYLELPS